MKSRPASRQSRRLPERTHQPDAGFLSCLGAFEPDRSRKKYDEVLARLEDILSRDPDNPDARLLQAKNWLAKQENKKAIDGLERLSHSYPSSPAIKFELARAYLQDNKLAQATAALTAAIVASPNYPDAVLLLAQINQ